MLTVSPPTPPNPFRNIGATVAGLVAFVVVVFALEALVSSLFAHPDAVKLNPNDPAAMATLINSMPMEAKLIVVLGYFLGTLAGAYVAALFAASPRAWNPYVVGAFYAISSYMNFSQIPHPVWMVAASVAVGALGVWLGARLGFARRALRLPPQSA